MLDIKLLVTKLLFYYKNNNHDNNNDNTNKCLVIYNKSTYVIFVLRKIYYS